ncbi:MAG: TetR/AcrR family transcriptional regulator [Actinomycetota bacterium]|nr:TetR/AcrR family transcriptional regulator [Actinomycetota bacterium]
MQGVDRPYHHGNLHRTLVEAAVRLARTGGPDAVVLRAVSREAGVSHNAAYRHFVDRVDLLAAVSEVCMLQLATLMAQRTAAVSVRARGPRASARLNAVGRAYIEFARTEPGWFKTAFSGTPGGPKDSAEGEAAVGPFDLLSARLDELVEADVLPAQRRPGAEFAAWSMVHGLSTLLIDGPLRFLPDPEVDALITAVLDVVKRGL